MKSYFVKRKKQLLTIAGGLIIAVILGIVMGEPGCYYLGCITGAVIAERILEKLKKTKKP